MPEVITDKPKSIAPRAKRSIDISKAIRDRSRGLSLSEIAAKQGVTPQGIHKALNGLDKLAITKEELEDYRKREVSIIDTAKMRFLLAAVDEEKLKSASALQCVTGFGILTDKSLLLQGKATQIVENKSLVLQAHRTLTEIQERLNSAQIIDS